jgi:hypothetical protein
VTETKARKQAPAKKAAPATTNGAVKPKPKPGDAKFDWQTEYPGEELFVFTAADGTTVGLTRLGPKRRPKPGKLALLERRAGWRHQSPVVLPQARVIGRVASGAGRA